MGKTIWYFIHQVNQTPSGGDHCFEASLYVVQSEAMMENLGDIRYKVKFGPRRPENHEVQPVSEISVREHVILESNDDTYGNTYVQTTTNTPKETVLVFSHFI